MMDSQETRSHLAHTALVTGASRGIGAAIASEFRTTGMTVVAPGRDELDLLDTASINAWIERNRGLQVDVLVNNAGTNELSEIDKIDHHSFSRMMTVNLWAPLALAQAFLPGMAARGFGRVVNVASIWAHVARSRRGAYSSTKAGLIGLTRVMAVEYAGNGVLVNAVCPGFVATELTSANNTPAEIADLCRKIPAGRLAHPSEIAKAVRWFCSPENTYLTGQSITIDGGYTSL